MQNLESENSDSSRIFSMLGIFPSGGAQKELRNDLLDVQKLEDTAVNESFQPSKIRKILVFYACPVHHNYHALCASLTAVLFFFSWDIH